MNDERIELPEELRRAVAEDLEPVTPLPAPGRRMLFALPVVLLALILPLWVFTIRSDSEFDLVLGWIPVAVQLLLAAGLLLFALRESIPGRRVSSTAVFVLCLTAFGLQILVNLGIYLRMPMAGEAERTVTMWLACFRYESLIGLPILVVVAWLAKGQAS